MRAGLGEEASELAKLRVEGVPLVAGELVALGGEADFERVLFRARDAAARAPRLMLRPLLPTQVGASRLEGRFPECFQPVTRDELEARVRRMFDALASPQAATSGSGMLAGVDVLIYASDCVGHASSAGRDDGDPDVLSACSEEEGAQLFRIDRRSARVLTPGSGLDPDRAADAADLADRAQLALGYPVRIRWEVQGGRPRIAGLSRLALPSHFTRERWRRVALVAADEGTVAPLAIDALDRALRVGPSTVRRIFARPYRLVEHPRAPDAPAVSVARASERATRLLSDVAGPIAVARRLERASHRRLAHFDEQPLDDFSRLELMASLRDREAVVREAFVLLDRQLDATRATLAALGAAAGPLPRAVSPALAAPRATRARVRALNEMAQLWRTLGQPNVIDGPPRSSSQARAWRLSRDRVATLRPLGIDVAPTAFGLSDATFARSLAAHPAHALEIAERARSDAKRRLLATGRARGLGVSRRALVSSLMLVLGRLAAAKGTAAEVLASAMLRLRVGAVEVGRRLMDDGLLERAEDAIYLGFTELEEALRLEPGAYASRARFRREDDRRWRSYAAPARVGGAS